MYIRLNSQLVLMASFSAKTKRGSDSLLRLPFISHVHVFLKFEISILLIFAFLFFICFVVIILLFMFFDVSAVSIFAIMCRSLIIFMKSLNPHIDLSTLCSMLASPPPLFLDTYNPPISSFGCKAKSIVKSFLVFLYIFLVLPMSITRMVATILQRTEPRCLSL